MQELTFETILRLPQMELKKRLKAELKSRGYPVTDKPGYLYAEGTIPVLLVAPHGHGSPPACRADMLLGRRGGSYVAAGYRR